MPEQSSEVLYVQRAARKPFDYTQRMYEPMALIK